jgi:hypothetical protein
MNLKERELRQSSRDTSHSLKRIMFAARSNAEGQQCVTALFYTSNTVFM